MYDMNPSEEDYIEVVRADDVLWHSLSQEKIDLVGLFDSLQTLTALPPSTLHVMLSCMRACMARIIIEKDNYEEREQTFEDIVCFFEETMRMFVTLPDSEINLSEIRQKMWGYIKSIFSRLTELAKHFYYLDEDDYQKGNLFPFDMPERNKMALEGAKLLYICTMTAHIEIELQQIELEQIEQIYGNKDDYEH